VTLFSSGHALAPNVPAFGADIRGFNCDELHGRYLEVLTNETNAFSTELGLVQAQLNELLAVVQLYQALGGGWQQ
jgi:hypothetical protein